MRIKVFSKVLLIILGLIGIGLLGIGPKTALATNPTTINFQGKVVNSNGTNVADGTYSFVFRVYNASSPTMTTSCTSTASCLWQETQGSVTVTSGIFQVELGSSCALTSGSCNNSAGGPINFASNNSLYLTMQFNGDTSGSNGGYMSPLIHITSVPFALQADNADKLDNMDSTAFAQLTQAAAFTGPVSVQPSTNVVGLTVKQNSNGSPTADILDINTQNNTSIIAVTGPAINEAAVTITSVGATRDLTLGSASGTIKFSSATTTLQKSAAAFTLDVNNGASDSTLTISNSGGAGKITLALDTGGVYAVGSSTGSSVTCSSGNYLNSQVVVGGIITGGSCSAAGGTPTLNSIGAATAANTPINNGDYKQTWQWDLTSSSNVGLLINESSASNAAGTPVLVQIDTLATSTAIPLNINNVGAASAFRVQDNGTTALTVDSSGNVIIGSNSSSNTTQNLLQLNSYNSFTGGEGTCTTSTNQGAMYYNNNTNTVRVCINASWEDMVSTAGLGIMLFGVVPDSGSNPGDLLAQSATAHTTGPCKVSWKQNASAGNAAQVNVAPCVAYSGGRKVIVANTTVVSLDGTVASQWEHLCFNSSGALPTTLSAATSTETNTTNDPNASYLTTHEGAPYLCLADIQMTAGTGNTAAVNAIYDVRTFTTTIKEYATSAAAMALGVPAAISGVNVTNTSTSAGVSVSGIVVATDMSTSTSAPNVILAVEGPTYGKALLVSNVAGDIVRQSATASRLDATIAASGTLPTQAFGTLGINRSASSSATSCATTGSATNCDYGLYFFQSRR